MIKNSIYRVISRLGATPNRCERWPSRREKRKHRGEAAVLNLTPTLSTHRGSGKKKNMKYLLDTTEIEGYIDNVIGLSREGGRKPASGLRPSSSKRY